MSLRKKNAEVLVKLVPLSHANSTHSWSNTYLSNVPFSAYILPECYFLLHLCMCVRDLVVRASGGVTQTVSSIPKGITSCRQGSTSAP